MNAGAGEDSIEGGTGNDLIAMAGTLNGGDRIDGGIGADTVTAQRRLRGRVVFAATTMVGVETLSLGNGHSYKLTLDDADHTRPDSPSTARGLTAPNALFLDGSAELNAALTASCGAGDDTLIGGAGIDLLNGGAGDDAIVAGDGIDTLSGGNGNDTLDLGADFTAADKIDGGANVDLLKLDGDLRRRCDLRGDDRHQCRDYRRCSRSRYALTLANATNSAGLTVDASALGQCPTA